jgi:hypothetical protein
MGTIGFLPQFAFFAILDLAGQIWLDLSPSGIICTFCLSSHLIFPAF